MTYFRTFQASRDIEKFLKEETRIEKKLIQYYCFLGNDSSNWFSCQLCDEYSIQTS